MNDTTHDHHIRILSRSLLLLIASLGLITPAIALATEPLAASISALSGTRFDYAVMAALLGATSMLIFINVGQAFIRHEFLNLWLATYIGAVSLSLAGAWYSEVGADWINDPGFSRKSLSLMALVAQAMFIYRFAPSRPDQQTWTTLFVGLHLILLGAGLWLLSVDNHVSYRGTRMIFFIGTLLCITHMALMLNNQQPFTKLILLSKTLVVTGALCGWWLVQKLGIEKPVFFWFGQSLVIFDGMIITYVLVMNSILNNGHRMQTLHERSLKLKLKKQYNKTLKRVDNELRTPLSGIVGIAELLLDTSLNKTQRDQIVTMRRTSESLLKWLNRLNDWRALQIGRLNFDAIPFDFSQLLNTLCEDSKAKAEDRKIGLDYHLPVNAPTLIKGDPARIKQIISGTLDMALYYSEQGEVSIALNPTAQRNLWRLEIRDSQSGLQPEDIEISLSNDVDIEAETYSSVQRNWVIARALATHIGGKLSVSLHQKSQSVEAVFVCELTLPRYSLLQHHEHHYDKLLQHKRLLVVDDSSSSRKLVAKRADSWGMKVTCVPSGKDALAMIGTMSKIGGEFDVIILDHDMPEMTGFELAKKITEDHPEESLPVMIMLSGANEPPSQQLARSAAIKRVLTKPISAKSLKITLAEELTLHHARQLNRPTPEDAVF